MDEKLQKIIEEEIKRTLSKRLYIFDFDHTLIEDSAQSYLLKTDGTKMPITSYEYYNYELLPGEKIDATEFDMVIYPKVFHNTMSLLKHVQKNAVILTARTNPVPVRNFLLSQDIDVEVHAVGVINPGRDTVHINAERKRDWIDSAIIERKLTYVEFWDDCDENIELANTLQDKHPDITIVTHLVKH